MYLYSLDTYCAFSCTCMKCLNTIIYHYIQQCEPSVHYNANEQMAQNDINLGVFHDQLWKSEQRKWQTLLCKKITLLQSSTVQANG